jgi:hypothetical protein
MDFSRNQSSSGDISAYWKYDFAGAHISLGRVRIIYSHAMNCNGPLHGRQRKHEAGRLAGSTLWKLMATAASTSA